MVLWNSLYANSYCSCFEFMYAEVENILAFVRKSQLVNRDSLIARPIERGPVVNVDCAKPSTVHFANALGCLLR